MQVTVSNSHAIDRGAVPTLAQYRMLGTVLKKLWIATPENVAAYKQNLKLQTDPKDRFLMLVERLHFKISKIFAVLELLVPPGTAKASFDESDASVEGTVLWGL